MSEIPERPAVQKENRPGGAQWAAYLTSVVGEEIRYWRRHRRLSGQELAQRTSDLGLPIPRNVIANLENRRRDSIGVAEVLVLAAALDVPPVQLIAPVGRKHRVEILPHVQTSSWRARGWVHGATEPEHPGRSLALWQDSRRAITMYDIHRLLVREHQQIERRIDRLAERDPLRSDGESAVPDLLVSPLADALREYSHSLDRLRTHRAQILAEGFVLPDLPRTIAAALDESRPTGRHRPAEERPPATTDLAPAKVYEETLAALKSPRKARTDVTDDVPE